MSTTITATATEPANELTAPTPGADTDTWGEILNEQTFVTLLAYILWLHENMPEETSVAWGEITGTLTDQTDLGTALSAKADTSSLATVATTGAYSDLSGTPSLGTAAAADTGDFATAAQGAKADAALPKLATVNSYAGNRTLDSSDSGAYVRITAAGTVILPDGLSAGSQCVIVNATDSDTVALSAATTLNIPSGFEAEIQNRRAVTVIHVGSNVWDAHGALVETP